MKCMGWTENDIAIAARRASERLGEDTRLIAYGPDVIAARSRRGGQTIRFLLRFESPTKRKKDNTYPPGVLVRDSDSTKWHEILDPIPLSELVEGAPRIRLERKTTHFRRSCGVPCWHAFGHFIRALFEINVNGCIVTREARYDGADGFEETYPQTDRNIGSMMYPAQYSELCDCHLYGTEDF